MKKEISFASVSMGFLVFVILFFMTSVDRIFKGVVSVDKLGFLIFAVILLISLVLFLILIAYKFSHNYEHLPEPLIEKMAEAKINLTFTYFVLAVFLFLISQGVETHEVNAISQQRFFATFSILMFSLMTYGFLSSCIFSSGEEMKTKNIVRNYFQLPILSNALISWILINLFIV